MLIVEFVVFGGWQVFSMVARFQPDVVVHIAAIPDIEHNPPHQIFTNNISATFNVVEACIQLQGTPPPPLI